MLVQESLSGETLFDSKHIHVDTLDEAYETLSLSDLPLYSDQSADWDQDYLSLAQSHGSASSSQQDCFEFFSQELDPSTATTTVFPQENIMFCGKLIPYEQPFSTKKDSSTTVVQNKRQRNDKKKCRWSQFRWKFNSGRGSKNRTKSTTLMQKKNCVGLYELPKKTYNTTKLGKGHGPMHKMSILTSSSSGKLAKWHLFLFGISRFPTEVELRDIKSRQITRRQCPSPPPMFKFQNRDDEVINEQRNNRGWGLWGLIRALSCG
ncbi:uncharacterized protein LOC105166654 [Sesamum indicum]|uniref:Uncharacterized protein LOC105166654 n=1 Tax=Sesamum indicum TaxID=4182 RepID=A0A6I9TH65_SESIN|nr:uncharacterized protein LOC105166654 [Sesamum indicum]